LTPSPGQLAPALTLDGLEWERKHEFHVTAAHTPSIAERIRERLELTADEAEAEAWEAVREAATAASAGAVTLSERFFSVRRAEDRTLIRLCDVAGLGELFGEISRRLDVEVEPPPAHVTLYTAPGGEAIGLHTHDELERDATLLDPAAAAVLRRAADDLQVSTGS
jgi:hypothetical protein